MVSVTANEKIYGLQFLYVVDFGIDNRVDCYRHTPDKVSRQCRPIEIRKQNNNS